MDQKDCVFSNVWTEEKADNFMQIARSNATNQKGAVIQMYTRNEKIGNMEELQHDLDWMSMTIREID